MPRPTEPPTPRPADPPTAPSAAAVAAMLRSLARDCEADAHSRDGLPANAHNLAIWLGEMDAKIAAVASALAAHLESQEQRDDPPLLPRVEPDLLRQWPMPDAG